MKFMPFAFCILALPLVCSAEPDTVKLVVNGKPLQMISSLFDTFTQSKWVP